MGSVLFSHKQSGNVVQLLNMIQIFFSQTKRLMLIPFMKLFTCGVLMKCMQGIAITKGNGKLRHY